MSILKLKMKQKNFKKMSLICVMVFYINLVLFGNIVYGAVTGQKQYTDPLLPEEIKISPIASMDINKNVPIEVQEEQKK